MKTQTSINMPKQKFVRTAFEALPEGTCFIWSALDATTLPTEFYNKGIKISAKQWYCFNEGHVVNCVPRCLHDPVWVLDIESIVFKPRCEK